MKFNKLCLLVCLLLSAIGLFGQSFWEGKIPKTYTDGDSMITVNSDDRDSYYISFDGYNFIDDFFYNIVFFDKDKCNRLYASYEHKEMIVSASSKKNPISNMLGFNAEIGLIHPLSTKKIVDIEVIGNIKFLKTWSDGYAGSDKYDLFLRFDYDFVNKAAVTVKFIDGSYIVVIFNSLSSSEFRMFVENLNSIDEG